VITREAAQWSDAVAMLTGALRHRTRPFDVSQRLPSVHSMTLQGKQCPVPEILQLLPSFALGDEVAPENTTSAAGNELPTGAIGWTNTNARFGLSSPGGTLGSAMSCFNGCRPLIVAIAASATKRSISRRPAAVASG